MLLLALLTACSPVRLYDDTRLNLEVFGLASEHLASPYVVGSDFALILDTRRHAPEEWSVTSTNPDVLALGAPSIDRDEDGGGTIIIPALAVGVGTADVIVRDEHGEQVLAPTAEVAAPTRLELRSASDLERTNDAEAIASPKVCVGGTSAFRVDFFDGNQALAGSGGLSLDAPSGVALADETSFAEDSDWIVLTPDEVGALPVGIATGGEAAGTVTFDAVPVSDIVAIDTAKDDEGGAEEGEWLAVVATGLDAGGTRVFGAPFAWTEDGVALLGEEGDVFTYAFDADVTTEVTVAAGDVSETFSVHGTSGSVRDSSSVACAVANVGPVGMAVVLAVAGVCRRRKALLGAPASTR